MLPNPIVLPRLAARRIALDAADHGLRDVETGGFLLARDDSDVISTVAFVGTLGITRRRDQFRISERAVDRLFAFVDDSGHWIPSQFHSHRAGAFLSRVDVDHGLSVEGFSSTVVPQYASPPPRAEEWGWWRFEAGQWRRIAPPEGSDSDVEVVRFDEGGVRAD